MQPLCTGPEPRTTAWIYNHSGSRRAPVRCRLYTGWFECINQPFPPSSLSFPIITDPSPAVRLDRKFHTSLLYVGKCFRD